MATQVSQIQDSSTRIDDMRRLLEAQRSAYRARPMPTASERTAALKALRAALLNHRGSLIEAINADFNGRSQDESLLAEIIPALAGIDYAISHVRKWMKPSRRKVSAQFAPARAYVMYQPLGVTGIIVPWNYPLYLALAPLTGALAAGNRIMIKMSEFTPHTAGAVSRMLAEAFPPEQVTVITGEADVAAAFSALPLDHLLFTGSTTVGRHVMRAAAENLTPVTLELGGKSPAIISEQVSMRDAVPRLSFGKMLNAGQTCVAPDYVLCPRTRIDEFVREIQATVARMYPSMKDNPDYTAIINERQYKRLQEVMDDARGKGARFVEINPASETFSGSDKMPPQLVLDVSDDMRLMQDEIFGPLLPVVPYDRLEDAIAYVNDRPRPLALYYFDYDRRRAEQVLRETHSGGVCINDSLSHVAQDDMPFGGIGPSGMGHYHGHEGFLTFSHARSVFSRPKFNSMKFAYPPYGRFMHKLVYKLFLR